MTLKQEAFIAKLPQNNLNISKTMREVGYSEASSRSGRMYAMLRNKLEKTFTPEIAKRELLSAMKRFKKEKDNTNYARMVESLLRSTGVTKPEVVQGVSVSINDAIAQLKGNITGNQKLESPCATTG